MVDAQYERRGVKPEFRTEAFHYNEAADKYVCPAGHDLRHFHKDNRRPGIIQHSYRAKAHRRAANRRRGFLIS